MLSLFTPEALSEAEAIARRPLASFLDNGGRTAVVTGAARGLGLAIALRLAESGATVVMADRRQADIEEARAEMLAEWRDRTIAVEADMRDSDAIARLAERAAEVTGTIDIWVNNAGIFPPTGPLRDADATTLDDLLAVNVRGVFLGAREAARRMRRGAAIVNIASIGAIRAQAGMSGYSASKHAVLGLTRSLAAELGKDGIRVIAVAPGLTVSPGNEAALEAVQAAGHRLATLNAPLGRIGLADDVARVVMFAASDLAAMMTGQLLVVDGGTTA